MKYLRPKNNTETDLLALHCNDILNHPEFLKLKEQSHHYTSDVFTHSKRVADLSARICKILHFNHEMTRETVRAALLHDFYDFDRVERRQTRDSMKLSRKERITGCFLFQHPKSAAEHASSIFEMNNRQLKAIRSHMFPLAPFPTNIDAWIITASDKCIAFKEGLEGMFKKEIFKWKDLDN